MNLRSIFPLVAAKKLVAVDLPNHGSNQHEINGVADLRELFSGEKRNEPIQWAYFADDREPVWETGTVTFYDARAKSHERTGRSEWRLYYYGDFIAHATEGDVLVLARRSTGELYGLVFQAGSAWLTAASSLFSLEDLTPKMLFLGGKELDREIDFATTRLLDELGIDAEVPIDSRIETLAADELKKARADGRPFPNTQTMSKLARTIVDVGHDQPDEALMAWLEAEEALFRAVEAIIVGEKLEKGFESVDDFISYSLSVQNRRKSRMGYALQNHLEHLFAADKLRFETQAVTEGKNRPDFLFPGSHEYHDSRFDPQKLRMLGAKSSCKERWRQILTEAERIPRKHLCTLEGAISRDQTDEMKRQGVLLVIPNTIRFSYGADQRKDILSAAEFMTEVKGLQTQ